MKTYRKLCTMVWFIIAVLFLTNSQCWAKQIFPYGEPKAKKNIDKLVPLHRAEKIALKEAREVWGKVSPGPYLEACDDDGDIVAYYFTFSRGTDTFPEYEDILATVKYGRKVARNGLRAMNKKDQEKVKAKEKKEMEELESTAGELEIDTFSGQPMKKPLRNAQSLARIKGNKIKNGTEQFGAVVVSARYDRFPIPLVMHYLHPYFCQGDIAVGEAKKMLNADTATVERIYFLGRSRGQHIELSAGGEKVLFDLYSLEEENADKVLSRKGEKVLPDAETLSAIQTQWDKVD